MGVRIATFAASLAALAGAKVFRSPVLILLVAVGTYVGGALCLALRCWAMYHRASSWRLSHLSLGSVEAAELAFRQGTPYLLVCGGELVRDVLGAKLGADLARHGGMLAFFSSGHFKQLSDFAPISSTLPSPSSPSPFDGIDLAALQPVLKLDREALDTLSNFTTFVRHLERQGLMHRYNRDAAVDVVIVTSKYHVRRVWALATVVLGSQGLSFHIAEAPSEKQAESLLRCARDVLRALLWLGTGFEGDVLAGLAHRDRRDFRAWYRQRGRAGKDH
ncbi:unnamed protein product [Durusdinium trenchii]|uniref:DUF218 domain-containing protein n=1 Tax=Durusdinium trenchii TaxID=1381693 RepID=A0ABP0R469_9DINO